MWIKRVIFKLAEIQHVQICLFVFISQMADIIFCIFVSQLDQLDVFKLCLVAAAACSVLIQNSDIVITLANRG